MFGAIDIGGTKIAVGLVENGRLLDFTEIPTDVKAGPRSAVERSVAALDALRKVTPLAGIGIGSSGPINTTAGRIENPYTLPGWETIAFTNEMAALAKVPVKIENDVGTALLGVVRLHGWQDRTVVLAMFGTGVGISVSQNGKIFRNRAPYHPEFGALVLRPEGERCFCGREGCVEAFLSGPSLHRRARALGFPDFSAAVRAGSPLKQAVFDELRVLANTFAVIFQPEVFCFGGGIANAEPELFQEGLASAFRPEYAFTAPCVVQPIDDRQAALVGAASLCE